MRRSPFLAGSAATNVEPPLALYAVSPRMNASTDPNFFWLNGLSKGQAVCQSPAARAVSKAVATRFASVRSSSSRVGGNVAGATDPTALPGGAIVIGCFWLDGPGPSMPQSRIAEPRGASAGIARTISNVVLAPGSIAAAAAQLSR